MRWPPFIIHKHLCVTEHQRLACVPWGLRGREPEERELAPKGLPLWQPALAPTLPAWGFGLWSGPTWSTVRRQ